jgi:hypothetical protein
MMALATQERIGMVNVWELHHFKAPLMRVLARHEIDRLELGHYLAGLLATGRWELVKVAPHRDANGHPSDHIFEVYGQHQQPPS